MRNLEKGDKVSVILLAGKGDSTNILYNYFHDKVNFSAIIIESKPRRRTLLKNRGRKIGYVKVSGQILFNLIVVNTLKKLYADRIKNILEKNSLSKKSIPKDKIYFVDSVNSDTTRNLIKKTDANFILVNGTRIIGRKTLECKDIKFVNIHAGITPRYRGVHGGYWAMTNEDLEHCGVTLHFVDTGVDTGSVIGHSLINPTKDDSFVTYPILQLAKGIKMLELFFEENEKENYKNLFKITLNDSKQYYHPTIIQYFLYYFKKGVK